MILTSLTKPNLVLLAEELGIPVQKSMRKPAIIEAISKCGANDDEVEECWRAVSEKLKAKTAQLVRKVAELDEAPEKQAQLEKRVEELVTPAAGDDASARAQNNEWHAGGNADPQGVTDAARTSGVRQRRADSGNKESPEAAQGSGGSPARSLAAVVNHSSPRTPAKVPAKDQRRRQVIVVGDSNMARVGEVIKGRVGDDERMKVSKLPGKE
ncbi:hypothetical protein MRX96_020288 [Rhipicephalus microplus]